MVITNGYLTIFALAMMGCVLATPLVTHIAAWVGAIDRPDQFRRIHQGAIPRLGGLGLAMGIAAGMFLPHLSGSSRFVSLLLPDLNHEWAILGASLLILVVGFVDDTRSLGPRVKLAGQALAVLILFLGGIRIQSIEILGLALDLGFPSVDLSPLGLSLVVPLPSLGLSMLWFLGCMNVWNLIDGMDGLASGVGLLVSGTLTLVAIHNENIQVAILAVALAGSLAGFLLYNWHPACIFLGDSGALLIGLLIGVIGVEGSMKGPSAISILFPILAMGLPISDTAMAIFRRWVRNLPLSAADRRHVHHLLIGLGLNPRQAAVLLYCFSGFMCGAVLLGAALRSEFLALVLGTFGCLAFLLVVTSRRDELAMLREDLQERMVRGRQERQAAKLTWEAIQRIELCKTEGAAVEVIERVARRLGCSRIDISGAGTGAGEGAGGGREGRPAALSGPSAHFRIPGGEGAWITVDLEVGRGHERRPGPGAEASGTESEAPLDLAADIVFRCLHRLGQALAARAEELRSEPGEDPLAAAAPAGPGAAVPGRLMVDLAIGRLKARLHGPRAGGPSPASPRFPVVDAVAPSGLARR
ncbi:WecA-like glycosyltransferase [Aquisphaera giovannonii]|uniref:WecA-like glycosyltransferase n=1 Tax=Aquisphaera giovannonii TaxID=406548 RepID=A0A5B9VV95_9BACT|nr:MraY family glycosyltransferase [Aquisphaera giovannonii]QEH31695.1 WecA-like glycosyltransferase [Aquisphaera giovannonii]